MEPLGAHSRIRLPALKTLPGRVSGKDHAFRLRPDFPGERRRTSVELNFDVRGLHFNGNEVGVDHDIFCARATVKLRTGQRARRPEPGIDGAFRALAS